MSPEPNRCPSMEDGTPLTCEFERGHRGPHSFDPPVTPEPNNLDAARRLAQEAKSRGRSEMRLVPGSVLGASCMALADSVGSLADEVERLWAALKRYGHHVDDCPYRWLTSFAPDNCSCGLDALLAPSTPSEPAL